MTATETLPLWGDFDGETYEPERDRERIGRQILCVRSAMSDHRWHVLAEIARTCNASEASVSARLRDLRKRKFGAHDIEREYIGAGLWHYRMAEPEERP